MQCFKNFGGECPKCPSPGCAPGSLCAVAIDYTGDPGLRRIRCCTSSSHWSIVFQLWFEWCKASALVIGRANIPSLFLRSVLILHCYVWENITVLISKKCPYLWLASLFFPIFCRITIFNSSNMYTDHYYLMANIL